MTARTWPYRRWRDRRRSAIWRCESQISLTDPDARGMATRPKVGVGYNAQVAVDAKHKLIVEQHVSNAGSDLGLLAQTAGDARELLGVERIDAVADKGYYKGEDITACEEVGVIPYVARPQRGAAVAAGRFAKDEFAYDAAGDFYRCPAGHRLDPVQRLEKDGRGSIFYSNRPACRSCPLKPQCTAGSARRIECNEGRRPRDTSVTNSTTVENSNSREYWRCRCSSNTSSIHRAGNACSSAIRAIMLAGACCSNRSTTEVQMMPLLLMRQIRTRHLGLAQRP